MKPLRHRPMGMIDLSRMVMNNVVMFLSGGFFICDFIHIHAFRPSVKNAQHADNRIRIPCKRHFIVERCSRPNDKHQKKENHHKV